MKISLLICLLSFITNVYSQNKNDSSTYIINNYLNLSKKKRAISFLLELMIKTELLFIQPIIFKKNIEMTPFMLRIYKLYPQNIKHGKNNFS